jgi:hypothetical protein
VPVPASVALIVEDEAIVRMLLEDMRDFSHTVVTASNADEPLEALELAGTSPS